MNNHYRAPPRATIANVTGFDALIPFDEDPDKGKIDYYQVIRHECGHAVVAIAKGKRIKYIRLGRLFRTETHADVDHDPKDNPREECLIACAGVVAERRFTEGVLEGAGKFDRDNVEWWVRRHPDAFPGFEDTAAWFEKLVASLEPEADQLLVQHTVLFGALAAKLDELIADWDWKPQRFALYTRDIDALITARATAPESGEDTTTEETPR
jgi:hypothetical protein